MTTYDTLVAIAARPHRRYDQRFAIECMGARAFISGYRGSDNPWRTGELEHANGDLFDPHQAWLLGFGYAMADNNVRVGLRAKR